MIFIAFLLGQLAYGQLDIAAELLRETLQLQFFSLFGGVAQIFFARNFCRIYRALRTAKPYPDLFIQPVRGIGKVDREYLAAFLVRQAERRLGSLARLIDNT